MEYGGSSYVDLSLCLAACIVSAPLNAMSPSLSTVAYEFHFSERERDLYLASYLSLLSMFGQLAGSVFTGFVGDYFTRRNLVLIALIVSGISCLSFSFSMTYSGLAVSRLAMGFSQGSAIPAFFSILGDSHKPESRPGISALVSSSLGGGMMLGQLFAGYVLSIIGWRNTFIVIAFITLVTFCIVHYLLKEPERGLNEGDLSTYILSGKSLPKMTMDTFVFNIMIPSIFLLIVQTIPNTIPWGVLSTHLHDLLATDLHLTMEEATAMIAIFGVGAAAGGKYLLYWRKN